ncbi:MAG: DUF1801 domain-containing protein [Saprospiraceae bacterium]|jgi:uncharacterized protein YdhG (YjbR/CyaY superfamily)|nr:DUF1801 domain-containing protein [Saprospiraceae bacterium]
MNGTKYNSIEQYLSTLPKEIADILTQIRKTISLSAPDAIECIAYNMPAFKLHKKPLVYFAAFKNHIGFYALPSGNAAFQKELSNYKSGKRSVQFPLDQEMPFDLISQIVGFRVHEVNEAKQGKK